MNAAQKTLVERTLGVIGYVLLGFVSLIFVVGIAEEGGEFVGGTFDSRNETIIVWPILLVAVVSLWVRAFLKAGKK